MIKICSKCTREFDQQQPKEGDPVCFRCALLDTTGGLAPEVPDINTARLLSGTWTPEEEKDFWEEARRLDPGSDSRADDYYGGFEDDDCYGCGKPEFRCICESKCGWCQKVIEDQENGSLCTKCAAERDELDKEPERSLVDQFLKFQIWSPRWWSESFSAIRHWLGFKRL